MFGHLESDSLGTILKDKLLISPSGYSDQAGEAVSSNGG